MDDWLVNESLWMPSHDDASPNRPIDSYDIWTFNGNEVLDNMYWRDTILVCKAHNEVVRGLLNINE